jgi:hypothetical protein
MAWPTRIATLLGTFLSILLLMGAVANAHAPTQGAQRTQATSGHHPAEHGGGHQTGDCSQANGAHCASPSGIISQPGGEVVLLSPLTAPAVAQQTPQPRAPALFPKPPRA